jgi:hypothetical protein
VLRCVSTTMGAEKRHTKDEVQIVDICGTSTGCRRRPLTRSGRREHLRSEILTLRHLPSGKEGSVEIPPGHYSKKELQRLREEAKLQFLETIKASRS